MKTIYLLLITLFFLACGGKESASIEAVKAQNEWQKGYDSAKNFLKDSLEKVEELKLAYRNKQRKRLEKEINKALLNPPNDGHIHDGTNLLEELKTQSKVYDVARLARVGDSAHLKISAFVPLIAKKGLIIKDDNYNNGADIIVKHPHIEYNLLTVPIYLNGNVIDSAVIAIANKKIPR